MYVFDIFYISGNWYVPAWLKTGLDAEAFEFQLLVLSPAGEVLETDPRGRRTLPPPQYDTAYRVMWGYRESAEVLSKDFILKLDLADVAWNGWITGVLRRGKITHILN